MSVAYFVIGVPILVFSLAIILNIGRWSSIKNVIPVSWRLILGFLWLIAGCALLLAGALHKVTYLVWVPVLAGVVVYFYFVKKTREA